jgi:hypothetical protein
LCILLEIGNFEGKFEGNFEGNFDFCANTILANIFFHKKNVCLFVLGEQTYFLKKKCLFQNVLY